MAKLALIESRSQARSCVTKYAAKHAELKAIIDDQKHSMESVWTR